MRLLTYEGGTPVGPGGDCYADGGPQTLFDSLISESPERYHGQVVYYGESGAGAGRVSGRLREALAKSFGNG